MTKQEDYELHRAELQAYFSVHQDKIDVAFGNLAKVITGWMEAQGFWETYDLPSTSIRLTEVNKGVRLALIHSEISECLEAIRNGDKENEEEELADAVIRILDYCGQYKINLGAALCEKMQKNLLRPQKHGKAF